MPQRIQFSPTTKHRSHAMLVAGLVVSLAGCRRSDDGSGASGGSTEDTWMDTETTSLESSSMTTQSDTSTADPSESTTATPDPEDTGECGNGVVEADEACDEGGVQTATCEADCNLPACGDGIVNLHAGEACDEGGLQTAACEAMCTQAVCGDGIVNPHAGEACDEGEANSDSGSCTLACQDAVCGDGLLGPNEECDDGNEDDTDECNTDCFAPREVFVTSKAHEGNFGGLDGADAWCASLGHADKHYVAWLSTGEASARSRLDSEGYRGWYQRVDGMPVARGVDELCLGTLDNAVVIDDAGQLVNDASVWTNTRPDGQTKGPDDCSGWTSVFGEGHKGHAKPDITDMRWTDDLGETGECNSGRRLYCIEVKPKP